MANITIHGKFYHSWQILPFMARHSLEMLCTGPKTMMAIRAENVNLECLVANLTKLKGFYGKEQLADFWGFLCSRPSWTGCPQSDPSLYLIKDTGLCFNLCRPNKLRLLIRKQIKSSKQSYRRPFKSHQFCWFAIKIKTIKTFLHMICQLKVGTMM